MFCFSSHDSKSSIIFVHSVIFRGVWDYLDPNFRAPEWSGSYILQEISGVDFGNPKFALPDIPDPNFRVDLNAHREAEGRGRWTPEGGTPPLGAARGWAAPRPGVAALWRLFVSPLDSVFVTVK
jgi:hypothetical protein